MRKNKRTFRPLLPGMVLILALGWTVVAQSAPGNKENGLKIYGEKCWWCHGESGEGDGPAAEFVNPPPRDFSMGTYKYVTTVPGEDSLASDEDIFRIISDGAPGTSMPLWKDVLSEQERWDLVAAVKGLTDMFDDAPAPRKISTASKIESSPESIARGKEVFQKAKCYECHGESGRGDGMKKLKEDSDARVWPRNLHKPFTFRGGATVEDVFYRITAGIPNTPMPAFGKGNLLTDEERWHVANYVVSLADSSHEPKKGDTVLKANYQEELPTKVDDPKWEETPSTAFFLVPNIIAKERFFVPTNDTVKARALFNDKEVVILLEWADRTKSVPGDSKAEELAEEELFEDAMAIQFPGQLPKGAQKPYFGHGDKEMKVNMWHWKGGSMESEQAVRELEATGFDKPPIPLEQTDLRAGGEYDKGLWRVLFRRSLDGGEGGLSFEPGKYMPIAFANWDGSNGEVGSRHTLTTWYWILLIPEVGSEVVIRPLGVMGFLALGQLLFSWKLRRKKKD